ncbi:hypothetical protein PM082_008980 [Marasmius tenuissimus]|nr:hypothetical protein PM082_008980 [Marasmius tenuissimus]
MSLPLGKVIAEYRNKHTELIQGIARVDYAPGALAVQQVKIADLQVKVEEGRANLDKLLDRVKKQKKAAESSDSLKFNFKLPSLLRRANSKGKNKAKERDDPSSPQSPGYIDALKEEANEREKHDVLVQELTEAELGRITLEEKTREYNALKVKLDALYDLIFNGPTMGYPEEDQLEQQVSAARAVLDRVQVTQNTEKQAYECLYRAEKTLRDCKAKLKDGLQCAATSMFASGRSVLEKETSCLQSAHALAIQTTQLVQEARQLSPGVKPLETLTIAQTIPTRTESESGDQFYAVLKSAASEVARAHTQLAAERASYSGRAAAAKHVVEGAEQTLAQYKEDLSALRKRIFEDIAEKMLSRTPDLTINGINSEEEEYSEAPPSYQYEPPSTFVPPLLTSGLDTPNKYVQQLPATYSDYAPSPVSSSSHHIWPSPSPTTPSSVRRSRPLPRPPGS